MRELTPSQERAVTGPVTKTWHYLSVELDQVMGYTNGKERVIEGIEYKKGHIGSLSYSAESASISIWNPDGIYTMDALMGKFYRNPVVIMTANGDNSGTDIKQLLEPDYVEPDYYETPLIGLEPIIVFSGHISDIERVDDYLHLVASRSLARKFPRGRIISPFANHTPRAGTVFYIGSRRFIVEGRFKRE